MALPDLSAVPKVKTALDQLDEALRTEVGAEPLQPYVLRIVAELRSRYALQDSILVDEPRSAGAGARDFTFGAPRIKREGSDENPLRATATSKRSARQPSEAAAPSSSRNRSHAPPHIATSVKREREDDEDDPQSTSDGPAPPPYLSPFGSTLSDPLALPPINPTTSYVSQLNELCQKKRLPLPKFDTSSMQFFLGPAGLKHFASVSLQGHTFLSFPTTTASLSTASLSTITLRLEDGSSTKKVAKESAAKEALNAIYRLAHPPE